MIVVGRAGNVYSWLGLFSLFIPFLCVLACSGLGFLLFATRGDRFYTENDDD